MFSKSLGYPFQGVDAMGYHKFGFKLYIATGSLRFLLDRQYAPAKAVKEALET